LASALASSSFHNYSRLSGDDGDEMAAARVAPLRLSEIRQE